LDTLTIGKFKFNIYSGQEAAALEAISTPIYVYDKYSNNLIRNLNILYGKTRVACIGLLFNNNDVDKVLRHINIFDSYTFVLIPEDINLSVYKKIYDFFIFSPMSSTYIHWFGSLLLKPNRPQETDMVACNGENVSVSKCGDCFLSVKGCNKKTIFTEIYHPLKNAPAENNYAKFCFIQRHFSRQIVSDMQKITQDDLNVFKLTKETIGAQSRYWIDPFRIYG
jgi:hypothetical protein